MKIILQQNKEYLKYRNKKCNFYDIYGVINGYFKSNNEILFLLEVDEKFKIEIASLQELRNNIEPEYEFYEGNKKSQVVYISEDQIGKTYFKLLDE